MKIYKNKELTEEIKDGKTFDFGRLEAGQTKRYKFWVLNNAGHITFEKLKFSIDHEEVKVIEAPTILLPNAVGELVFEWKVLIDVEEGVEATVQITAKKIAGAR